MAKNKKTQKKYATEEAFQSLENTAQSSEHFLEKNAKVLGFAFGALVLVAIGYFAYLRFVVEPKNEEATKEVTTANTMFEQDSMSLALNGSTGAYMGYNQIIDEYSGTDVANIARFKAGIASYKEGKYKEALNYFKTFKTSEEALKAVREGAMGDSYAQLGQKEEALASYVKAAKATDLQVLQSTYTKKAAILGLETKKYDEPIALLEKFTQEYDDQLLGGEMQRLLALLKNAKK